MKLNEHGLRALFMCHIFVFCLGIFNLPRMFVDMPHPYIGTAFCIAFLTSQFVLLSWLKRCYTDSEEKRKNDE
jgi:hypothetical protein